MCAILFYADVSAKTILPISSYTSDNTHAKNESEKFTLNRLAKLTADNTPSKKHLDNFQTPLAFVGKKQSLNRQTFM